MNYSIFQDNNRILSIVIGVIFGLIYFGTDSVQDNLYCNNSKCVVETKNFFGITISKQKFNLSSVNYFKYDRCQGVDFHKSKREHRKPLCIYTINKYNSNSTQITKAPIRTENRIRNNIDDLNGFLKEKTEKINYDF